MDLSYEFEVPLSIDEAWSVLTDLERVAPCLPGAQLDEIEGDEYRGRVKIKVGPITVEYKGTATFVERLPETHVAVLRAQGRETKGQGSAAATVTATLTEAGAANTKVDVLTVLDISGRVAQFGRGALADVSSKILGQFAANLEKDLASGASGGPGKATSAATTTTKASVKPVETAAPTSDVAGDGAASEGVAGRGVTTDGVVPNTDASADETASAKETASGIRQVNSAPVEPVRIMSAVGPMLLKRLSPIAILGVIAVWLRHRRHKSSD
ncbi:MAG TPA: SRPBCC family protein [Acidimicrobiales bacterium]